MKERFRSKYLDIPNAPLYPFGYGLSYTTFAVSDVVLDQNEMDKNGRIAAKVTVKNTGDAAGCEVVQLYIRDDYSDVVRPVKELKGFRKVELAPVRSRRLRSILPKRICATTGSTEPSAASRVPLR